MGDALEVEGARPADHAADLVALVEQELGQVGAVLAGDAGDQCSFRHAVGSSVQCVSVPSVAVCQAGGPLLGEGGDPLGRFGRLAGDRQHGVQVGQGLGGRRVQHSVERFAAHPHHTRWLGGQHRGQGRHFGVELVVRGPPG